MVIELQELIERARKYEMTEDERAAQVRSFAYGNTHFENDDITADTIDEAIDALKAERGRTVHT